MTKFWLLPSSLSVAAVLLLASEVQAANVKYWRFDAIRNRLEFGTDQAVQPSAQLIMNPTRLIVELPNTNLGYPMATRQAGMAIKAVKAMQYGTSTRLEIELRPGYALDPQQLQVQGITDTEWVVQLPQIQRASINTGPSVAQVTPNEPPLLRMLRGESSPKTTEGPSINTNPSPIKPPVASNPIFSNPPPRPSWNNGQLATIESVDIVGGGAQVLIKADQSITYQARWDLAEGAYRLNIPNSQLSSQVRGPQWSGGNLRGVRLRQQSDRSVSVLLQPNSGVQVSGIVQSDNQLVVQLQQARIPTPLPPVVSRPTVPDYPPNPPRNPWPAPTPSRPNTGRVIVMIDPGHGGQDGGAISNGIRESDVVLSISRQVAALLSRQGIQVVMTRDADYFVTLQGRVDMAQSSRSTIFVSIHANAASSSAMGVETFYYQNGGALASAIQNSIIRNINVVNRGVKRARFYVLRNNSIPSVLVETGFVTNPQEAAALASPSYQSQMARAIAQGILQYLGR